MPSNNWCVCVCVCVCVADVTRVLLLDESHAQSLSTSVTTLLRELSVADAVKTFPVSSWIPSLFPGSHIMRTHTLHIAYYSHCISPSLLQ